MTEWEYRITGVAEALERCADGDALVQETADEIARLLEEQGPKDNDEWADVCDNIRLFGGGGETDLDFELADMYDLADALKVWIEPTPERK